MTRPCTASRRPSPLRCSGAIGTRLPLPPRGSSIVAQASDDFPRQPGRRSGRGAASVPRHLEIDGKRKTQAARDPLSVGREQHTVLVVDDSPAGRYAVARMLRAAGFKTKEARNGAEALVLAPSSSAAVLDVHLPDIHGLEVCRLLRKNPATASLPIVHLSGIYVSEEDGERGRGAGADAYLIAPVSPQELTGTLDKLLATFARTLTT
jgi:CheY-like chemotaxis protein